MHSKREEREPGDVRGQMRLDAAWIKHQNVTSPTNIDFHGGCLLDNAATNIASIIQCVMLYVTFFSYSEHYY